MLTKREAEIILLILRQANIADDAVSVEVAEIRVKLAEFLKEEDG